VPKEKRVVGRIGTIVEEEVMYITHWHQSLITEGKCITVRVDSSGKESGLGVWLVITDEGMSAWAGGNPIQIGLTEIDPEAWKKEKYVHVSLCEVDYS
jgi:hypothetical protein